MDGLGFPYTLVDLTTPENQQRDGLLALFEALTDVMESDACYYADATFGTKTYPLVLSSALHYAEKILDDTEICGIYYRELTPCQSLRLTMLKPADGVQGVKDFVMETVKQAGANPCPPIVLGIGIGGSFDKCAALAKKALLRPLDQPNADPYYAALEKELLDAINATGFGPQGFGGATTCLGVCIEQLPTHVACLPVAVNVSCHVTRRASAEV